MKRRSETRDAKNPKIPHLLKYMGSKREIIDFVKSSVDRLNVNTNWFCDLFSGTGVVAGSFKGIYNIHANDIQSYSAILAQTYLLNLKNTVSPLAVKEIHSKLLERLSHFHSKYPFNFDYSEATSLNDFVELEQAQQNLIQKTFKDDFHLFTRYYSGTYWSFEQCMWIDAMRAIAEEYKDKPHYYVILSCLIFSMSYTSQSTGHYAQYRDANTESSMNDIIIYRKKDLWPYFERKFIELTTSINGGASEFKTTTLDYIDCLRIIEKGSIVYADPPYQSVHYSRFYHILETLVRYDYPKVLFKGRYRDDRHQSPFCKKKTVEGAFTHLFEGVKFRDAHLVLSYSDTGMISLEDILNISEKTLNQGYERQVLDIDHIHSKMGRSDIRHHDVKEYAILFKRI
ncbi:DNA adenine methylase [Roseivirga sp. BDSF3-8]|uniref:DNA adenine methylase n=1 Tax=Roseivirga sp. BDSF3-8 TaxID=3241598 RepID=UPI00353276F5